MDVKISTSCGEFVTFVPVRYAKANLMPLGGQE